MKNDVRRPGLEVIAYVALAATALLVSLFLGPELGRSFGLVDPVAVEVIAMTMVIVLGLPTLIVLPSALILSIIQIVIGPRHVRLRVALWYVLGPGLFMVSLAVRNLEPQYNPYLKTPDPGVTVGVVLTATALVLPLLLPIVWLFRRGPTNVQPPAVA